MTFAVGASIGIVRALARGVGWAGLVGWPARVWLLGVGGLFGYHALYFAALQLAPPAEANLVNYLWPLLIVLLSAPLAGERLGWPHLLGALLGFAGVALLAFGRGVSFAGHYALGYALALGCAFAWSLYSVLSRRFGETPTDAIAAFCAASALLSLVCHLLFERTVWPASTPRPGSPCWRSASARPGAAFYLWDHAVKRGDIRALGALSYATPILSTALLIACGLAEPTGTLLIAALLVTGGVLARRSLAGASSPASAVETLTASASPAAPARSLRTRRPAPRCSRPGSRRRASARPARHGAALRPAAARRRRSRCRGAGDARRPSSLSDSSSGAPA